MQRRWKATGIFHRWLPHEHQQRSRGCSLHSQLSHNRSMRTLKGTVARSRRSRSFMDWWPIVQWRSFDEVERDHAAARQIVKRMEENRKRVAA